MSIEISESELLTLAIKIFLIVAHIIVTVNNELIVSYPLSLFPLASVGFV